MLTHLWILSKNWDFGNFEKILTFVAFMEYFHRKFVSLKVVGMNRFVRYLFMIIRQENGREI